MTYFNKPFNTVEQPIEKDRYRLLWAALCPYAHRAVVARKLLGLDNVISLGTLDYRRGEDGWRFSLDPDGVDPVLKKPTIKSVYNYSEPNYEGPYSVPALVDLKTEKIVRKESAEILHEFATIFKPLHKKGAIDLYQTPGFGDTTDFEAIKVGYYLSGGKEIVPGGPSVDKWQEPHDRLRF